MSEQLEAVDVSPTPLYVSPDRRGPAALLGGCLYRYSKGMSKISAKNQVTIPVTALEEAGLRRGDPVVVEALEDGELRIRRSELSSACAFGALTGVYPPDYLAQLDREDANR